MAETYNGFVVVLILFILLVILGFSFI
ncbi:YjcZ family sporulation protein [Priestia aryabhattai]